VSGCKSLARSVASCSGVKKGLAGADARTGTGSGVSGLGVAPFGSGAFLNQ